MVEGLALISGISPEEITSLAKNLKGQRKNVPSALNRVAKDKVYLLDDKPAVVNGKGEDFEVTLYHHAFCGALVDSSMRNGAEVASAVSEFFRTVGGLNAWMQGVTGWSDFTKKYRNNEFGISYKTLEAELMWEALERKYEDEEERLQEYGRYFGVRPEKSMQVVLPPKGHLPLKGFSLTLG